MSIAKWVFLGLILALSYNAYSQDSLAIGQWRSHLPYQNGLLLTQSQDKVIYATEWSLLIIDKEERSYDFMSKTDGLSDIGISKIKYDHYNEQLIIAYTNSNIDIFKNGRITNLPNIRTSDAISGDRTIYNIHIANESFAYLATGFGMVELGLKDYNFGFTSFTGLRVNDVATLDSKIVMATEEGLFLLDNDGAKNPVDFNNWVHLGQEFQLPLLYNSTAVEIYLGSIYVAVGETLWMAGPDLQFRQLYSEEPFDIEFLSAEGENLICGLRDGNQSSKVVFFASDNSIENEGRFCTDRLKFALEDQFGQIWYADEFNDIRVSPGPGEDCTRLKFNSPLSHETRNISLRDDVVYLASGGVTDNYNVLSNRSGIYVLEEGNWTNVNQSTYPEIAENDLLNFITVLSHPSKNLVYSGTYWGGLMEWNKEDNSIRVFDQDNSSLGGVTGDEQRERITGLAFDSEENLWISNFLASKPISVYTAEETWHSFSVISDRQLTEMAIDQAGYKWFAVFGNRGGILIYDSGENIQDPTDDRQRFVNTSNSVLTSNSVHSIAVDLDGAVWVGTAEGPVVFDCGTEAVSANCTGRRILVLQDSIPAFLLSDTEIRDIEIDGANRKWFGTRDGIFVQSADGETELLRFTAANSPLFDNNIIDMGYNGRNGEMFIASDKGVQSYRSTTSSAKRTHSSPVYAFPNPVRPEYRGPIVIKGLARDANVKITDINGVLVYETTSLGGQAIWEGTNFDGVRASTGVYLVFSSTTNNFFDPDTYVAKILFIK